MKAIRLAAQAAPMKRRELLMLVVDGAGGLCMSVLFILQASGLFTPLVDMAQSAQHPWAIYLVGWAGLPLTAVFGLWAAFVISRYGRLRAELAREPYYLVRGRPYVDFALSDEEFGALCEAMSRLSALSSSTDRFYVRILKQYIWHLRRHWLPSPGAVQITRFLTMRVECELRRYERNTGQGDGGGWMSRGGRNANEHRSGRRFATNEGGSQAVPPEEGLPEEEPGIDAEAGAQARLKPVTDE